MKTLTVYAPGATVNVIDAGPPPSGLTDPAITDAAGGMTSGFVYGGDVSGAAVSVAPLLPWQGQDNTVVASVKVGTGYVGKVTIDLAAICKKGVPVQIGLKGAGATSLIVGGIASATPATLAVVYDDGSTDTLSLDAEVEVNPTTAYLLNKQATLPITSSAGPWYRFAAPKRDVQSAPLTLTTTPKVYTGGTINVVRFTAGYLPQPATLAPWGGTLLMQTQCWEDGPAYITDRIIQPAYDLYGQRKFVTDDAGDRALELWTDPRQSNLLDLKVGIYPEVNEAWYSYDLMIMPGANKAVIENGKLPGFATVTRPDDDYVVSHYQLPFPHGTIGTLIAGNGGGMVHGNDGWSDRGDWLCPRYPPHPLAGKWPLSTYCYNPDFVDFNGQQLPWDNYGTGVLDEGRYYHIEHRLRVNSVPATGKGNNDGELEARVDGKLALFYPNLRLRDAGPYAATTQYGIATAMGIRNFWLCAYHGGHNFPTLRLAAFRMKNFKIYRIN
jgi:hypothetical protein